MRSAQNQENGGQKQKRKTRNSSLELLRIIAIIFIIICHCSGQVPWDWSNSPEFNADFVSFMRNCGEIGVGIFFIISGFFLQQTKKFNWKRVFKIIRPVWFYSFTIFALAIILGKAQWGYPLPSYTAQSLFPVLSNSYWFVGEYIGISLLFPFFKKGFDRLTKKQLLTMTLIIVGLVIVPAFFDMATASQYKNFIKFPAAFMFTLIGYTLARFKKDIKSPAWAIVGILSSFILFILIEIAMKYLPEFGFKFPWDFMFGTHSLPVILAATSIFVIFMRWEFYSRIINYVAGLSFGIYIFSENIWVRSYIWHHFSIINPMFHTQSTPFVFMGYFFGMVLCVFLASGLIETMRQFGTKVLLKIMNFCSTKNYGNLINIGAGKCNKT